VHMHINRATRLGPVCQSNYLPTVSRYCQLVVVWLYSVQFSYYEALWFARVSSRQLPRMGSGAIMCRDLYVEFGDV